MTDHRLKFGILGCAAIAPKYIRAIRKSSNCEVVAVGSRDLVRAQEFARLHNIAKAYGSYDEVLRDKDVVAVYIPLPTTLHREWTEKAAAAGKHVLCEKPLAPTLADVDAMIAACRAANVMFMDGTMFTHHPRTAAFMDTIAKEVQPVARVVSAFSWRLSDENNIRFRADCETLGALGDLGWYCVRATLHALHYELPVRVAAFARYNRPPAENGVIMDISAVMHYCNNTTVATFDASFATCLRQWVEVSGATTRVCMNDFVVAAAHSSAAKSYREETELVIERHNAAVASEYATTKQEFPATLAEVKLVENFARLCLSGAVDTPAANHYADLSRKTMQVVLALNESALRGGVMVDVPQ